MSAEDEVTHFVNANCSRCEAAWSKDTFSSFEDMAQAYFHFYSAKEAKCRGCGEPNPNMEVLSVSNSRKATLTGPLLVELGEDIKLREVTNPRMLYRTALAQYDYSTIDEVTRSNAVDTFDTILAILCEKITSGNDSILPFLYYCQHRIQHLGAFCMENDGIFEENGTPRELRKAYESSDWMSLSGDAHVVLEDGNFHLIFDGLRY